MRMVLVALVSVVAASTAAANTALWTDPTGRFTLGFEQLGWESVPSQSPDYLTIESVPARAREKFLQCIASTLGTVEGSRGIGQERINDVSRRFGIENVRRLAPEAEGIQVEHSVVDGIVVADIRFTVPSNGGLHHHIRTFFLSTSDGVVQHLIMCGGAMPVRPEDDAEIDAVLSTLRFSPTHEDYQ